MKRIMFLDFDGVLNNVATFIMSGHRDNSKLYNRGSMEQFVTELDKDKVRLLDFTLTHIGDVEVVISSNWRKYYTLEQLRSGLGDAGLSLKNVNKIVGVTKIREDEYRAAEIAEYLSDKKGYNAVIVDDHLVNFESSKDSKVNLIKTNSVTGLTIQDVKFLLSYLSITPNFKIFNI